MASVTGAEGETAIARPARGPLFDFDYVNDPAVLADVHAAYWAPKQNAPRCSGPRTTVATGW